jgi:hypothetical protein
MKIHCSKHDATTEVIELGESKHPSHVLGQCAICLHEDGISFAKRLHEVRDQRDTLVKAIDIAKTVTIQQI